MVFVLFRVGANCVSSGWAEAAAQKMCTLHPRYVTLAPTYITFSALQPGLVYMQNFIEIVLCVPYWESFEKLFKKLF
jgi:hypothetical protein